MKQFQNKPSRKRVKEEFIDFTIIHDREFLPIEKSEISTSQKTIYSFDLQKEEDKDTSDETKESLHDIDRREFPEIHNPYQVMGVTYTFNRQNFNSVYKKWTNCNLAND